MIDIDRNRRFARLLTLAKKPDEPMRAWLWWSTLSWESYIGAMRYMKQQNLTAADLQLHNESEIA